MSLSRVHQNSFDIAEGRQHTTNTNSLKLDPSSLPVSRWHGDRENGLPPRGHPSRSCTRILEYQFESESECWWTTRDRNRRGQWASWSEPALATHQFLQRATSGSKQNGGWGVALWVQDRFSENNQGRHNWYEYIANLKVKQTSSLLTSQKDKLDRNGYNYNRGCVLFMPKGE